MSSPLLQSRLQYRNYEPGEYTDEKERTCDEINAVIQSYPWAEQRHLAPVGLTGPSVTIQDTGGNYLKLGPDYGAKYRFYLFTASHTLCKHTVSNLDEAAAIIYRFCNGDDLSAGFEHEHTLLPARHFVPQAFIYRPAYHWQQVQLALFTLVPLVFLCIGSLLIFLGSRGGDHTALCLAMGSVTTTIGLMATYYCIKGWQLLGNHIPYTSGQLLRLSRGQDEFMFGAEANLVTYRKSEIASLKEYRNNQRRNPWGNICYTGIVFADGRQIKISSLLMRYGYTKFPGIPMEGVKVFFPSLP